MGQEETEIKHPELRKGEVFVTNICPSQIERIGWKTKRLGKVAYRVVETGDLQRISNIKIGRLVPLFVQKSEVEERGLSLDKLDKLDPLLLQY